MSLKHRSAFGVMVGVGLATIGPAGAQTVSKQQFDALQQIVVQLQQQIQTMQAKEAAADARNAAAPAPAPQLVVTAPAPATPSNEPKVIQSANNQFGLSSADGKNTIELTGRLQADYADYFKYTPASAATAPRDLNGGANLRRARLGITGKFAGDFNYTFILDGGGSSDTTNPLNSGNVNSIIENAYVQYTGFRPVTITLGYVDTNWTLDESTSSNEIMFMERDTTETLANNLVAGDQRSVFGATWNTPRAWVGAFATGPQAGASHTLSQTAIPSCTTAGVCTQNSNALNGSAEQVGAVARAAYQVLQTDDYTLHVGVNGGWLIEPPHLATASGGVRAVSLADRPELRVDPTTLISSGTITKVRNAAIYGGELAGNYGPLYVQGEFFHFDINRETGATGGDYKFNGGYVEAAYTLTGESHKYNASTGAYGGIVPNHALAYNDGSFSGAGAWEIAARASQVSLNDHPGQVGGISGGDEHLYTVGLNWYATRNIKFMVNYIHGAVDKINTAGTAEIGQDFDAIAVRSQFVW